MVNKAPYRHQDGSNCWTKNCSRGHKSALTGKPVNSFTGFPVNDYIPGESDSLLMRLLDSHKSAPTETDKILFTVTQKLNVTSAAFLKERFVTTLKDTYNSSKVDPVSDTDYWIEKPTGGIWLTPEKENGSDAWTEGYDARGTRYQMKLKPSATVAVIDSAEDYVALMQRFKHTEESFAGTGKGTTEYRSSAGGSVWDDEGNRLDSIDYAKLGMIVDALYVTQKGIAECGVWSSSNRNNKIPTNMATLSTWEIPTLLVFKASTIVDSFESKAPPNDYPEEDYYFDEENWG